MAGTRAEGRWARLPNAWIYDDGLIAFSAAARQRGAAGAALKVLFAIVMRAENRRATQAGPNQGSALLSYEQLIELTDLSRGMVAKGVALLRKTAVVTIDAAPGRTSRYRLIGYGPGDNYGRVPKSRLYRGPSANALKTLYDLSLRNEADVNAMKLYLFLCGSQDTASRMAMVNYDTISAKTGISRDKIRRALSVLYEHGLAHSVLVDQPNGRAPATGYRIVGL
jgi:DNA-binding transcriptional ArsR family regulator